MQSSKNISLIIKLFIVILAFYFLYKKVFANENLIEMYNWFLNTLRNQSFYPLVIVFLLMFLNWILDAIKWKYIIKKIEIVSLWLSIKAVFLGITVSIFTPNRIGEFGGRIFCLKSADRIKGVIITILGNVAQLLVTIIFGSIAFLFYVKRFDLFFIFHEKYYLLLIIIFIFLSIFIFLFINTSFLIQLLNKFSFLRKYKDYINVFSFFSIKELLNVILLSMLRYMVFSLQYFILLLFFEVDINFFDSFIMSSLVFFTISIIPTIAITEIGVRGSLAIYFFGLISSNNIGILTATFSLWIVNLVLPALIGIVFVYNLKFFRS